MGPKGKRKLEENTGSAKDAPRVKKSRPLVFKKATDRTASSGRVETCGEKVMPQNDPAGQKQCPVGRKEYAVTGKVKAKKNTFVKGKFRKKSMKKKPSNNTSNSQHSSMLVKKKTSTDLKNDTVISDKTKTNLDVQIRDKPVHSSQSEKKRHKKHDLSKRKKKQAGAQTVTEQSSNENAKPSVIAENISCNWKLLQQVLHKQKKKTNIQGIIHHRKKKPGPSIKQPENITETKSKIWFDDVDDILIESLKRKEDSVPEKTDGEAKPENKLVKSGSYPGLTKVVAVDCEMVGVGERGKESVLARVSIVNHFGKCVYDKYVKPRETVTDYRTPFSGIRREDLKNAEEFSVVQEDVSRILSGRILVGHALENDLKVLFLSHPRRMIRDTSKFKPFRKLFSGRKPALRHLADKLLMVKVQEGEHNSVQDAQAAMRLYTMYRQEWEKEIKMKHKSRPQSFKKKKGKKTETLKVKTGPDST